MPHVLLESAKYSQLSAQAVKLMLDLYSQYKGTNNGDFSMTWAMMRKRGWRSKDTLYRALNLLIDKGYIVQTRQGGRHQCSLYAVTWNPIDDCGGKLEHPSSRVALGCWKD